MTAPAQRAAITDKLAELAGNPTAAHALLLALVDNLQAEAKAAEEANRKGWKGQGEAVTLVTGRILIRAGWLETAAKSAATGPQACKAVNQLGGKCVRTDVHESHTFAPVDPAARILPDTLAAANRAADVLTNAVAALAPENTCGMVYPGSADPCLLDPEHVDRDEKHVARNSRWPVSPEDKAARILVRETAVTAAHAAAYLKGETDKLGTPALPGFESIAPEPPPIAYMNSGAPLDNPPCECRTDRKEYCAAQNCRGGSDFRTTPQEASVQPTPVAPLPDDPWTTAAPATDVPASRPAWLPEPDPRPFFPDHTDPCTVYGPAPASVHVTEVTTGEACGLQLRLLKRDLVPEQPAMWNVGGTAFHLCAEQIERRRLNGEPREVLTFDEAHGWFSTALDHAISMQQAESAQLGGERFVETSTWRYAAKGAESEAWWREHGPQMVRDYAAWSAQMHADGWAVLQLPEAGHFTITKNAPMVPALELELNWGVLTGRTDQVWCRWTMGSTDPTTGGVLPGKWEIRIVDPKSGASLPDSPWQLAAYAWMLAARLRESGWGDAGRDYDLSACFYDARNGKATDPIDPLAEYSEEEIVYRASAVANMHATNTYPANPGTGYGKPCGICAVRYACPIMALKG